MPYGRYWRSYTDVQAQIAPLHVVFDEDGLHHKAYAEMREICSENLMSGLWEQET